MVDKTTNIAAKFCTFHLPQPGQSKGFSTLCHVKTKQRNRLFDVTECSHKCFNELSRESSTEGLDFLKIDKNSTNLLCLIRAFLRRFRDPIRVPRISNRVPTDPYRVPNIFLKKNWFNISLWGLGALFGGLTAPKPPMATRLGPEQINDEGALEIVHEIFV